MNRIFAGLFIITAVPMLTSCAENDAGTLALTEAQPPLWLDVRLDGPSGQAKALMFEIVGGSTDSIVSSEYRVFAGVPASERTKALVFGDLKNDLVARVWLSNPLAWDEYRIVLEQVALDQDFEQQSTLNYSLQLQAPNDR